MPLRPSPQFKNVPDRSLELPQPGIGGLNLKDLEYEQELSQSPFMRNMMYRNGAFSKRFGQEYYREYKNEVYALTVYRGSLIIHAGSQIFKDNLVQIASDIPTKRGLFVIFNQNLYYINDDLYCYDGTTWKVVEPYVPTIVINRKPDGSSGNTSEAYNMLGTGFQNNFHGDGTSTLYKLTDDHLEQITPKVFVDNVEWTYNSSASGTHTFSVDYTAGTITLSEAAPSGTNNVEIIAYKKDDEWQDYYDQIMSSKYYSCFGGNNNSRLFLAGGGKSTYYYSEVYDASYFPYTNYAKVGNGPDDITGFGQQYNVLMIFKPTEIYSLTYYQQTSSTTTDESQIGIGAFSSQVVNNTVGCDCPKTIQLINNQLTWLSTREGVCTLVSTNIIDERNVRPISRNIDRTNKLGLQGILDWSNREMVVSVDWDNKYFLANPVTGQCFMWDYAISPYYIASNRAADPKNLDWFLFDNFYVNDFLEYGNDLIYISSKLEQNNKIIKLNESFSDFGDAIHSEYMTPLFSYDAVEYLKTIKNIYVQCRTDAPTKIYMSYITEESPNGEAEPEPIDIPCNLWAAFDWATFGWEVFNFMNTFRRKCSIKKTQVLGIMFWNNILDCDMSISHLAFQYQVVKYVK